MMAIADVLPSLVSEPLHSPVKVKRPGHFVDQYFLWDLSNIRIVSWDVGDIALVRLLTLATEGDAIAPALRR